METREETDPTTAPDEPPSRGRPRWLPVVLISAAGIAAATVIILLVQARLQRSSDPSRLRPQRLPGAIVRLPGWKISDHARGTVPGHITYRPPSGTGMLEITWAPGHGVDVERLSAQYRRPHRVQLEQEWIAEKGKLLPIWTSVIKRTGHPELQSTWLCTRPYVRYYFYLTMDTDAKALRKLAMRILTSVRCDEGTLFGVKMRYLPQLPREEENPVLTGLGGGNALAGVSGGTYHLTPGHPGRLPREKAAREVKEALHFAFGDRVTEAHVRQVAQALRSQPPGQRAVHSIEGVARTLGKLLVHWTVFYCAEVDQTFVASVIMREGVPPAPHAERLRRLACPAPKTAAEVLVDHAGDPEEK